jgi:hypothetical protein
VRTPDAAAAMRVLHAAEINAVAGPQGLRVELTGTEAPTVLALLVGAGIAVHEARRERTGLDDLFAKLTEGNSQ